MSLWVWGFSGGEGDSKHPLPLSGPLHTFPPWGKYAVGDKTDLEQITANTAAHGGKVTRAGERNIPIK